MKDQTSKAAAFDVAFIGTAGVPNRYGGFESFLEHCGPEVATRTASTTVTCDARLYPDRTANFSGVRRRFLPIPANGVWSVPHDLLAFLVVWMRSSHVVVLGVSGGLWFPLFRLLCTISGKRLFVNVDGVEWRRTKFARSRRLLLRAFDALAQVFSHGIIYDNPALHEFVLPVCRSKASCIGYSGDHVLRLPTVTREIGTALTVCRIEPENNIDLLIDGALRSSLYRYTIVGNWAHSAYGRALKAQYAHEPRLRLLDPIYDPLRLAELRECCWFYIHGHSVGGTNPSLVEMLFYDCQLLCYDVAFHRETAGDCAQYFRDADSLAALLTGDEVALADRSERRRSYSRARIAERYLEALAG